MTPEKSPCLKLSLYYSTDFNEDKTSPRDSEPPWTTSRCHRLLRPLSSKIALLRKMKIMGSKELCNPIIDTSLGHHMPSSWGRCKSSRSNQESEACSTEAPSMIDSSDWITDTRPRKRLRRTYSSKSNVQAPVPDPTPVPRRKREKSAGDILRMVDETFLIGFTQLRDDYGGLALQGLSDDMPDKFPNAPTSSIEWEVGCGQKTPLRGAFTKLARNLSPVNWRTLDGLHDGVLALLKATADEKPKELRPRATLPIIAMEYRSRSLFATCLRKIPDCIIEEQLSTTTEDPESDVDVSATMYNYLEQMNTSGAGGWRPLKDVVRAHGIAILVAAIKESLIDLPMARALMLLCVEQGAYDEAVTIVKAMITTMKPLPKPETSSSLLYAFRTSVTLQTVQTMGMLTRYSKFEFDHLAKLFDASIISFEWMYTPDMVDCWHRAVISATQGRSDANEAASLLCTVVAKAHRMNSPSLLEKVHELRLQSGKKSRKVQKLGKKDWCKAIQATSGALSDDGEEADVLSGNMINVFSNLLTVLCATSLLQSSRASVLTEIGQEARRSDELHSCVSSQRHPCDINHDHLGLSLLASTIATQPPDHHCLDALIRGITKTTPDFHVTAGTFLCNVAQCCGRVALKDRFEHLKDLINCLGHGVATRTYDESRRAAFNAIYINAAFKLAEQSGQPKHFEGALALEQRLGGGKAEHAFRTPGKTPAHFREQTRSGFRWEEGICEWVARSPEVAQKIQNACSDESVVVQESSREEDIASSIHPSFQDSDQLTENSPCARRIPKSESHGYLTENHSKCSNPEAGSRRFQSRRGRPKRTVAQKRKLHNPIVSDISVKDKPPRLGSSHELRNCVRQGCCAAPRIRRVGPIVVIEKAKLDVMFRAKGTVSAMSQGTGKGFKSDTESEDELSLL